MFINELNMDTIAFSMVVGEWYTVQRVCFNVNERGYALTEGHCDHLLIAMLGNNRVATLRLNVGRCSQVSIYKRLK